MGVFIFSLSAGSVKCEAPRTPVRDSRNNLKRDLQMGYVPEVTLSTRSQDHLDHTSKKTLRYFISFSYVYWVLQTTTLQNWLNSGVRVLVFMVLVFLVEGQLFEFSWCLFFVLSENIRSIAFRSPKKVHQFFLLFFFLGKC